MLRKVSVFGVRSGDGPGGIPINRSAKAAGVTATALSPAYRPRPSSTATATVQLTRDDLLALPQRERDAADRLRRGLERHGTWTGVRLRDLLDLVGARAARRRDRVAAGAGGSGHPLQGNFADDDRTLLALTLNGEALADRPRLPGRLIAPNRPGVLQTKWVTRIEVRMRGARSSRAARRRRWSALYGACCC